MQTEITLKVEKVAIYLVVPSFKQYTIHKYHQHESFFHKHRCDSWTGWGRLRAGKGAVIWPLNDLKSPRAVAWFISVSLLARFRLQGGLSYFSVLTGMSQGLSRVCLLGLVQCWLSYFSVLTGMPQGVSRVCLLGLVQCCYC